MKIHTLNVFQYSRMLSYHWINYNCLLFFKKGIQSVQYWFLKRWKCLTIFSLGKIILAFIHGSGLITIGLKIFLANCWCSERFSKYWCTKFKYPKIASFFTIKIGHYISLHRCSWNSHVIDLLYHLVHSYKIQY